MTQMSNRCNHPKCKREITAQLVPSLGRLTIVTHEDNSSMCHFHENCAIDLREGGHCHCSAKPIVKHVHVIRTNVPADESELEAGPGIEELKLVSSESHENALAAFETGRQENVLTRQTEDYDNDGTRALHADLGNVLDPAEDYRRARITVERFFSKSLRKYASNCVDPVFLHHLVVVHFYECSLKLKNAVPFKSGEEMAIEGMLLLDSIKAHHKEFIKDKSQKIRWGEHGKKIGIGLAKTGATVGIIVGGALAGAACGGAAGLVVGVGAAAMRSSFDFSIQLIHVLLSAAVGAIAGAIAGSIHTAKEFYGKHKELFVKIEGLFQKHELPYGSDSFFDQLKYKVDRDQFFEQLFEAESTEQLGKEVELVAEFQRVVGLVNEKIAKQAEANRKAQ